MKAIIDNDILLKGACYGLLSELVSTVCSDSESVGVLGSARFVLPKQIERSRLQQNPASALENLYRFLRRVCAIEPGSDEQKLAADLEFAAQKMGVSLDIGESQLCAILVMRALPLLLTGDKRAIAAIEKLLDAESKLAPIRGKVRCLEQLFASAIIQYGASALRGAVCSEPGIDKAISICFSCTAISTESKTISDGLQSYISALRRSANRVLCP